MTGLSLKRPASARTGYLPTLDGWRTVAIAMVLCAHMHAWPSPLEHLRRLIQPYGYLGVDVFFAISGLLICYRLLEEERLCGCISLKGFYIRRSFRIFPPALLYLGVVALLGLAQIIPPAWTTWWSAVFFLRNYASISFTDDAQNLYTAHFWSLAVEEHFYLLLPPLLVFLPRWRKPALITLTVIALVWLALYGSLTPLNARPFLWDRRTDLHIASLLFPAWLAVVLYTGNARERLRRYLRPGVLLAALALVFVGHIAIGHFQHVRAIQSGTPEIESVTAYGGIVSFESTPSGHGIEHVTQRYGGEETLVYTFVVPLFAPFLILSTLLRPESLSGRFLELSAMRWIGRLSYSLYLWQQIFWDGRAVTWPLYAVQRHEVLGLCLTVAAAATSFYVVERPLIRMGHQLAPPATPGHRDTQSENAAA
jgi:peptidoglycan/LPS O-acetylase OafA/YrhL